MGIMATVVIYGDPHLSSKNYGAHINYAKESLDCFRKVTKIAEENNATHLIGLGDFSYGRFHTLEYRKEVEEELYKQSRIVNGNHYSLKGNHDSASYGMTEYEYYVSKGIIKASENISIGNFHLTMVDSGEYNKVEPNIVNDEDAVNVIVAHDYFKFTDSRLPNFGSSINLDTFERWFGADYLICGHIHNQLIFNNSIKKNIDGQMRGHELLVHYPGSLPRPAYNESGLFTVGQVVCLVISDDGSVEYKIIEVDLLPIEESFNLSAKEVERAKKAEKERRVDISDIIGQLNEHQRTIGDPEELIRAMANIDERYKDKAIELLKVGQA